MIKGLSWTSVWSEDLNNLLPFYRDVLGLKVGEQSPEFVMFGSMDQPSVGLGTHSEVKGKNSDGARHMVGFESDDLEGDVKRLKEVGVEFIEEPTDYDGGMRMATLKDPEGNYIQIAQM